MKSRILIVVCSLFLLPFNIKAQDLSGLNSSGLVRDTIALQILDNARYRIFYALSFSEDTAHLELKTECQTVFLVGDKYNSFLDYNTLRKDSLYNALMLSGKDVTSVMGQTVSAGRRIKFKPIIIKNYPEKNNFVFQEMITSCENYRYEDNDIEIKWQLSPEEEQIENYKCKKATCSYRGRNYVAWYSPDIALTEGPYIFTGLPGLILKIYDDKGHYSFALNGLQQVEGYNPIYLPSDNIVSSTRQEVRKIESNLKANPTSILQMMGGKVNVSEETLRKIQPKPYNPIELE